MVAPDDPRPRSRANHPGTDDRNQIDRGPPVPRQKTAMPDGTQTTFTSPWMTTDQAANYLRVSGGTLRNWRSQGSGPTYRNVGRVVRYHREDLDAFMTDGANA